VQPIDHSSRIGFWYDDRQATGDLQRFGNQLRYVHSGPPWLIVSHVLSSVVVSGQSWPGRLWRVRVVALDGSFPSVRSPAYWRATAIEPLEELPLSLLFGFYGEAIVPLLDQIGALSPERAQSFLLNEHPAAPAAYAQAWWRWNEGLAHRRRQPFDDVGGPLALPSKHDDLLSPINGGFLAIHERVWRQARRMEGDAAVERPTAEQGDMEERLSPKWAATRSAYLYAAMALGAPQHVTDSERTALVDCWDRVFNPHPYLWRKRNRVCGRPARG
jgi:hypothetical protein